MKQSSTAQYAASTRTLPALAGVVMLACRLSGRRLTLGRSAWQPAVPNADKTEQWIIVCEHAGAASARPRGRRRHHRHHGAIAGEKTGRAARIHGFCELGQFGRGAQINSR